MATDSKNTLFDRLYDEIVTSLGHFPKNLIGPLGKVSDIEEFLDLQKTDVNGSDQNQKPEWTDSDVPTPVMDTIYDILFEAGKMSKGAVKLLGKLMVKETEARDCGWGDLKAGSNQNESDKEKASEAEKANSRTPGETAPTDSQLLPPDPSKAPTPDQFQTPAVIPELHLNEPSVASPENTTIKQEGSIESPGRRWYAVSQRTRMEVGTSSILRKPSKATTPSSFLKRRSIVPPGAEVPKFPDPWSKHEAHGPREVKQEERTLKETDGILLGAHAAAPTQQLLVRHFGRLDQLHHTPLTADDNVAIHLNAPQTPSAGADVERNERKRKISFSEWSYQKRAAEGVFKVSEPPVQQASTKPATEATLPVKPSGLQVTGKPAPGAMPTLDFTLAAYDKVAAIIRAFGVYGIERCFQPEKVRVRRHNGSKWENCIFTADEVLIMITQGHCLTCPGKHALSTCPLRSKEPEEPVHASNVKKRPAEEDITGKVQSVKRRL